MQLIKAAWTGAGQSISQLRRVETFQAIPGTSDIETYRLLGHDLTLDAHGNYCASPYVTCPDGGGVVTNYSDVTANGVPSSGTPVTTTTDVLAYAPYMWGAQIGFVSGPACGVNSQGFFTCYNINMDAAFAAADGCPSGPSSCSGSALAFVDADTRAGTRDVGGGAGPELGQGTMLYNKNIYAAWDTIAQKYPNLIGIVWYEAGYL